jgi:hypothetical protein
LNKINFRGGFFSFFPYKFYPTFCIENELDLEFFPCKNIPTGLSLKFEVFPIQKLASLYEKKSGALVGRV